MSVREFALPDLGEGLTESELVSWEVAVGDTVELNQVLAEVETAKALVQLPSPFAGVIEKLFVEAGTTVKVGAPIVAITTADAAAEADPQAPASTAPAPASPASAVPEASALAPEAPASAPSPSAPPPTAPGPGDADASTRTSVLVGYGPRVDLGERPKRRPRRDGYVRRPELVADAGQGFRGTTVADAGTGSGQPGRERSREIRTPIAGVRRRMAEAMVASAFTAPHATVYLTVDVTPTLELIERFRANRRLEGHRIGILALVAKASLVAIARTPAVNSRWDEPANEVVEFGHVNLGIAAATKRGLIVPNIRDAGLLTLPELADELAALTTTARDGSATPAQLTGGTFTITNVGVFGVDTGTPIVTPGEAAILAMGRIRRQPWEHGGEIALRDVMTLSLSFDHRLVDGMQGATFLSDVGTILSDPASAISMM